MAFTSLARLTSAMGAEQIWVHLSLSALRAMTAPIGVTTVVRDPVQVVVEWHLPTAQPLRAA